MHLTGIGNGGISGDLHQFEYLSFKGDLSPQLILGDGGTFMSKPAPGHKDFNGECGEVGKTTDQCDPAALVSEGVAEKDFGFGVITLGPPNQQIPVAVETMKKDAQTWVTLNCTLSDSHLHCK